VHFKHQIWLEQELRASPLGAPLDFVYLSYPIATPLIEPVTPISLEEQPPYLRRDDFSASGVVSGADLDTNDQPGRRPRSYISRRQY